MFDLVVQLLLIQLALTLESGEDILEALNLIPPALRASKTLDTEGVCYQHLSNYANNAVEVKPSKYRWLARVVHSRTADIPHVCTAVCIEDAIFITAAVCIYTLKIKYTTLLYMSKRLEVRAFVVPSQPTKQMFDDIGIIVVDKKKAKNVKWVTVERFTAVNRTDDLFKWFANLDKKYGKKIDYKVIGYALKKGEHRAVKPETQFNLFELKVVVEPNLCYNIIQQYVKDNLKKEGFRVPCYHTCSYEHFDDKNNDCHKRYLGVEGGAVFDTQSNKLLGLATWSAKAVGVVNFEMPVGFAFVNSQTFYQDLECAKWIRDDDGLKDTKGYYQSLCNGKAG